MPAPLGRGKKEERWRALLERYEPLIGAAIRRNCPPELEGERDDIAQEVRLRLWRAVDGETRIDSPTSYLYRISATAAIDAIRAARARRQHAQVPLAHVEADPCIATTQDTPSAAYRRGALRARIEGALGALAADPRRAAALHLRGFSSDEIAKLTGWTEPRAHNLASRAMAELRKRLDGPDEE
jgi:RNA polymerase sigma-70 factor (ECF subfamily)